MKQALIAAPAAANARDRDAKQILGAPNYDQAADTNYLTLGCGGTVIVRFTDNALVETPGPDLYVFEVGPQVEPTGVAISEDGKAWIEIGKVEGGQASVDIHPFVRPGQAFHFVRLTDLKDDSALRSRDTPTRSASTPATRCCRRTAARRCGTTSHRPALPITP